MKRKKRGFFRKICSFFIIVFLLTVGCRFGIEKLFPMGYAETVSAAAERFSVSPELLYAVIKAESNFDARATSPRGAKGLMQLMDNTAAWCADKGDIKLSDVYDPTQNIVLGAYYLSHLITMYDGNEEIAIAAYNAGHGRVDNWLSQKSYSENGEELLVIPFAETEKYVKKISVYKKIYALRLRHA